MNGVNHSIRMYHYYDISINELPELLRHCPSWLHEKAKLYSASCNCLTFLTFVISLITYRCKELSLRV